MNVETRMGDMAGDTDLSAEELVSKVDSRAAEIAAGLGPGERATLEALLRQARKEPELTRLAARPAEEILGPEELALYRELADEPMPTRRVSSPHLSLIMKATRVCNLRCTYCGSWAEGPNQVMGFEVLARTLRGALRAPGVASVELIWHGGEPTLRTRSFYLKALWLQQQWRRPGQEIVNNLQTNGTRLDPEWIDFLRRYRFKVGVSLDGPPEIHDRRRLDVHGQATSERVRAGLAQLAEHGIDYGICMVVDEDVLELGPERLLEFLLELGVKTAGLLAVVPQGDPLHGSPEDPYLAFPHYIDFLVRLFDCWWPEHADRISFREIKDLIMRLQGERGSYCFFEPRCMGHVLTIEPQGGIAACDKFQGDDGFLFGSVLDGDLTAALDSPRLIGVQSGTAADVETTRQCEWSGICHGACPHDRYVRRLRAVETDESCCGWGPLISHVAEALGR